LRLAHSSKKKSSRNCQFNCSQIQKDKNSQIFSKIEIAAPGFINFVLSCQFLTSQTATALRAKNKYGRINIGKGKKTQVEFISANPSGELHVGNGRSAFYGDALSNVLSAAGYRVEREYYLNDAKVSKQIQTLGATALGRGQAYLSPYLKEKIAALQKPLSHFQSETDGGYFLARQVTKDLKKFIEKN